jgi:L,D-transpeptidase ErfK/SrfK
LLSTPACSLNFSYTGTPIVGKLQLYTTYKASDSLAEIGRIHDLGIYEMIEANPHVNPWSIKAGVNIVIPSKFIVPEIQPDELVINLAEMRLYYLNSLGNEIFTYPIGIGKRGWYTPIGRTRIVGKTKNPYWRPPESIRREHLLNNDYLEPIIPPGPDNPLGEYAIRLDLPGILIHGTNSIGGIGIRTSHGCIRMFPEDVAILYQLTSEQTKVKIIYDPIKIIEESDRVIVEAHKDLTGDYYERHKPELDLRNYPEILSRLLREINKRSGIPVTITNKKAG